MLKLYQNLKPFTVPIIIVLVMVFLQSMANLYLPTLMGDIVDKGIMVGDTDNILKIGGTMLLYVGGGVVAAVIASYLCLQDRLRAWAGSCATRSSPRWRASRCMSSTRSAPPRSSPGRPTTSRRCRWSRC